MSDNYCSDECKEIYPYYGVAPHSHDLTKTGSFIGSTVVKDKKDWPMNFVEDEESPGCGTYYCPDCYLYQPDPTPSKKEGEDEKSR